MKLVRDRKEEEANRKWLDDSTTTCPGCEVHVEKSVGCNHVRIPLTHADAPVTNTPICPDEMCKM